MPAFDFLGTPYVTFLKPVSSQVTPWFQTSNGSSVLVKNTCPFAQGRGDGLALLSNPLGFAAFPAIHQLAPSKWFDISQLQFPFQENVDCTSITKSPFVPPPNRENKALY